MKKIGSLILSFVFIFGVTCSSILAFQEGASVPVQSQSIMKSYTQLAYAYEENNESDSKSDDEDNAPVKKSKKLSSKLARLDRDIEEAINQKNTGMLMAGGGVALVILSATVFYPRYNSATNSIDGNSMLYYAGWMAGGGLAAWGIYQWIQASNQEKVLEDRKSDMTLHPYMSPVFSYKKSSLETGMKLSLKF